MINDTTAIHHQKCLYITPTSSWNVCVLPKQLSGGQQQNRQILWGVVVSNFPVPQWLDYNYVLLFQTPLVDVEIIGFISPDFADKTGLKVVKKRWENYDKTGGIFWAELCSIGFFSGVVQMSY